MESTDHRPLLIQNRVSLVEKLDPDLILPLLVQVLGEHMVCSITKDPNAESKTRRILDNLNRLPSGRFDEFCRVIAGVHPTLFESLKGRCPSREERNFFIRAFRDNLCGEILKNVIISNKIDGEINLDTQYIDLLLKETNSNKSRKSNEEHSSQVSMVDIPLNTLAGKLVLFRGRAGVGKSILARYIIRKYAKDEESPFTLVFLLNLRTLVHNNEEMTLSELLGMYAEYQIDKPDPSQPSAEWLEENAQNVMVFTDGVDELPELSSLLERMKKLTNPKMKGTPLDWCLNLMKRNVLCASSVVLVSRPFIALRCLMYDLEVEVFGLTPEKIQEFITKNVQEEKRNVVRKTLEKNQVLKSVCTITFYCAAICKILEKDLRIDASKLTTYTRITASIITQLAREAAEDPLTSVIVQELSDCLPDIAALAYMGLFDYSEMTRLVFSRRDLTQIHFRKENVAKATRTGLLFFTEVKDPHNPFNNPTIEAEFLHLSVQEFLGIAKLVHSDEATMVEALSRFSSSGRFNMSQLFLCGLAMDQGNEHVAGIKRGVSMVNTESSPTAAGVLSRLIDDLCVKIQETSDENLLLQVIQMAYESQAEYLAKKVANAIAPNSQLILSDLHITAVDMKALVFILENSGVEYLALDNIPIDCASAHELSTYLKNSKSMKTLMLTNNNLTIDGIRYLSQGIEACKTLVVLKFIYNQITDEAIGMLASAVALSTTLKRWQIWDTHISDVGFEHVSKGVKGSNTLSHLELRNLKLSNIGGNHLAEGIKTSQHLEYLQLTYIEATSEAMRHIGDAVKSSTSLNRIRIEYTTITDEGMRNLCEGIKQSKTLKCLQLWSLPVTDQGMRHICEAVNSLECLDLMGNELTSRGWSLLFDEVRTSKGPPHLVLRYTEMTEADVVSFSAAIKATTSLKHLTLFNNQFFNDALRSVFDGLKASGSIENLELLNQQLSDGSMADLREVLACNKVLRELSIAGDPISDEAMAYLCKGVTSSQGLRSLKVNENDISNAGMMQLKDTLRCCPCELQPILSTERWQVLALGRFLKMNKKPVYINLAKANFTDSTHSDFMAALVRNKELDVFQIRMESSTMTDECAPALSDLFSRNRSLRHFSIQASRLSDDTFRELLVSLTDNTTLQVLQLDRATITRQSALSLVEFVCRNRTMSHLRFGENQVSEDLLSKLLDVLSENQTLQRIELTECLLPKEFPKHLIKFLSGKKGLESIRAVGPREENIWLEVTEVGSTTPISYPVSQVGGRIESQEKEQLTQELHEQLPHLGTAESLMAVNKVVPQDNVAIEPEPLKVVPRDNVSVEPDTEQLKVVPLPRGPRGVWGCWLCCKSFFVFFDD